MIINQNVKINIYHDTTAKELADALAGFPANAKVSVTQTKYYNQLDPGETYITVSWTERKP